MAETTALGAAMAAGSAEGIEVWDLNNIQPVACDIFNPLITEDGKGYFCRVFCFTFTKVGIQGLT
jgi:glycerol kinase